MKFMAWAYLIAFGSTWVVAGMDDGSGGELRQVGLTLLGLAWILGLGLSLSTLWRKD